MEECKQLVGMNEVRYELAKGTDKRFAGTYVHRYLYDHFMMWLDVKYALRVSIILDRLREAANARLIQEKDAIIAEQQYILDGLDDVFDAVNDMESVDDDSESDAE